MRGGNESCGRHEPCPQWRQKRALQERERNDVGLGQELPLLMKEEFSLRGRYWRWSSLDWIEQCTHNSTVTLRHPD